MDQSFDASEFVEQLNQGAFDRRLNVEFRNYPANSSNKSWFFWRIVGIARPAPANGVRTRQEIEGSVSLACLYFASVPLFRQRASIMVRCPAVSISGSMRSTLRP